MLVAAITWLGATSYAPLGAVPARVGSRSPRLALVAQAPVPDYNPNADPEKGGIGTYGSERADGTHGTGFRFMPMDSMLDGPSPVLMCLAGAYPGLTAEQLQAPQPLPFASQGKWTYHRLTGDTVPTGFVVLPGNKLLEAHPNVVGVVCTSESLGLELADGQSHEVIAVIDRSPQTQFDDKSFYAFADEQGMLCIRWIPAVPAGWAVLGRVLYTQLPFVPKPGGKSGFAECSDDFEF